MYSSNIVDRWSSSPSILTECNACIKALHTCIWRSKPIAGTKIRVNSVCVYTCNKTFIIHTYRICSYFCPCNRFWASETCGLAFCFVFQEGIFHWLTGDWQILFLTCFLSTHSPRTLTRLKGGNISCCTLNQRISFWKAPVIIFNH